jgi:sugar (pentulose or hexulose) kinase
VATFIGIDLGTSGCRAIAIDGQQQILAEATVDLPPPRRSGTEVEQDPELWWTAVAECLQQLTQSIAPGTVAAIAVDATSATLLLTDARGTPLRPALMYNDARATAEAERLMRIVPADSAAHGPSCALAKLLWLKNHDAAFGHATHVCHQADWIAARLCARFPATTVFSDYNNALKLGFDAQQQRWPDWLGELDLSPSLLPEVVAPGTVIGNIDTALAERLKLPSSTCIVAGTTDSTAAFLATGASEPGEAVTALGSTLVCKVISERPVSAPQYGVYSQPLISAGKLRWLVGGASNSGGNVLRHYFTLAQLAQMTPQLQADRPTGLDFYPLVSRGERFPVNDAQLAPRLEPRPDDDVLFFQAMLEGIARIEAEAYRRLAALGAPYPSSVRSTGGGAGNKAWTEIRGQLLRVPMVAAQQTEAAFGAAVLAANAED